jgi:CRP/FNR family transcriptional regulator, cyclic AMP receptor protein
MNDTALRPREAQMRCVLQRHYVFGKLNPKQIGRLICCAVEKSVARRTIIVAKDDPGSSLFAIREGVVKITVPSVAGHDAEFKFMSDGDIFGEIALFDGRPRTADVVAITDCDMFVIERRDFLPLVLEEPQIALKLIEIL